LKKQFQTSWSTKIDALILRIQQQAEQLNYSNTQINTNPIFIKGIAVFNNNQQYKEIEEKIKIQTNKLFEIANLKHKKKQLQDNIFKLKKALKIDFREYYNRIISIKEKLSLKSDKLEIKAKATLTLSIV
jgi:hypothetical protein